MVVMTADDHLSPAQFGFSVGSHDDWMNAQRQFGKNTRSGRLNLDAEVHTGQPGIFPKRVQEYVDKPGLASNTSRYLPAEIYHYNGQLWAGEGHHRIAAARQRGQKTTRVTFHGDPS